MKDNVAPILQDVDINYKPLKFNGSLLKENIYRENASVQVDAAWEALGVNCLSPNSIWKTVAEYHRSSYDCTRRLGWKERIAS